MRHLDVKLVSQYKRTINSLKLKRNLYIKLFILNDLEIIHLASTKR
jgi:hypothetical protein